MNKRINIAAFAFILYWVMFGVYYTSGIAFSSFWQIWCKLSINIAFLLVASYLYIRAEAKLLRFIFLTAVAFFSGMTCFYLVSFLLFNFFELAINDYVGYFFLVLLLASLIVSIIVVYGRKKQH